MHSPEWRIKPPAFPILRLTEDLRFDLPDLGAPQSYRPALLARLYDRLRSAVKRLSRYANQYNGMSDIVASLAKSLGQELKNLDYINLHLDFRGSFDLREAEEGSNQTWGKDARAATDAVLRVGPALTVAHPEVEQHEKSPATFQRRSAPSAAQADQKLAEVSPEGCTSWWEIRGSSNVSALKVIMTPREASAAHVR